MLKLTVLLCCSAWLGFAADAETVAYGKYLVEEVSKCQDCHSPRMAGGQFDKTKWLKGTALPFQPVQPGGPFSKTAPDLTSSGDLFKRWGEEGLVKFLEKGVGPNGRPPLPPMPAFTLRSRDAEAIVAYLKTL